MLRSLARWLGGIALHWFYRDVRVVNAERIPRTGPVLIAMNHTNALVDALMAMWVVPRMLRITAKATLGDSIPGAMMMRSIGIIPLRRMSDGDGVKDPVRNRASFERIVDELAQGGAVLVFPEGKSHNEPGIAPLKTGLARAALRARDRGVPGVTIVPIGMLFEEKSTPGTVVVARVGEPIRVDEWPDEDRRALTAAVAERLAAAVDCTDFASVVRTSAPASRERGGVVMRALAVMGDVLYLPHLRIARAMALRSSQSADEPAMYTMTYGLGLIVATYLLIALALCWRAGPLVAIGVVLALAVCAYAAAYAPARTP